MYCVWTTTSKNVGGHTIEDRYTSHITSYRDIDRIVDNSLGMYKDVTYDDQGNVAEIKYYDNGELALHNKYTNNVLKSSKAYWPSGELAYSVLYRSDGTVSDLQTWYEHTTGTTHGQHVTLSSIDSDGIAQSGAYWHSNGQILVNKNTQGTECSDEHGGGITCTPELHALMNVNRYPH